MILNQREGVVPSKRRLHVLVEFPEPSLECIVVQWESARPTVLVQLKREPAEPVQFPGKRADMPGNDTMPAERGGALDRPLADFVDGASGRPFDKEAYLADIVFSQRAFAKLQPEPDLVLPAQSLWEARAEALGALGIRDEVGVS
jgi:hypothetical protein